MRNDLLADIVTASGGTITDRNNRNLLLKDWLDAVQSPAISYVARPDGETQRWQLSEPIQTETGDVIEISFVGGVVDDRTRYIFGEPTFQFGVFFTGDSSSKVVELSAGTEATLNGQPILSGTTPAPEIGSYNVVATALSDATLSFLGARNVSSSQITMLPIYGFRLIRGGVVINEIPLTNKAQGATQLATVGSVNATMINYSEDVWEQV